MSVCNREQGGWEFDNPAESSTRDSVKRRDAYRQDRSRVMRKADRSHERKFLGWETKSLTPCPIPCSKDGWNKGLREGGTEEDEWCERSVACWSIHERCRERKVDGTYRQVLFFLFHCGKNNFHWHALTKRAPVKISSQAGEKKDVNIICNVKKGVATFISHTSHCQLQYVEHSSKQEWIKVNADR